MKKMISSIKTLAALLMAGAAFAACSSDDDVITEQPVNPTEPKTYTMIVQATKPTGDDAATRGLSLDGNTLNVKWNEGEKVWVMDGDGNNLGLLTADASYNATTTLRGTITTSSKPVYLKLYLHNYNMVYTGQTGVLLKPASGTDNSIESNYDYARTDISYDNYSVDETTSTLTVNGTANFVSHQAIVKFSLFEADGTTPVSPTSLTLTTDGHILKFLDYSNHSADAGKVFELSELSGTTNDIYVAISHYAGSMLTLTATTANGLTYTYTKQSGVDFDHGKYYAVKVKMQKSAPAAAEAVDLGLSVKWATMNVGAESVTDRGLYFAWGETTGHAYNSGYEFSQDNYAWYNSTDNYTKYKHNGSSWDYEVLESDDDAATRNWGGMWRMPTKEEWQELLDEANCSWTWTTDYNGSNVAGVIVTSKKAGYTDKSIFLPATGIYKGDNNVGPNIYANYWSKSLDTSNNGTEIDPNYNKFYFAWKLDILYNSGSESISYKRVQNDYRYYGIGVRAVRE